MTERGRFEDRVAGLAARFTFPETPDLVPGVRSAIEAGQRGTSPRPELAWAVVAALLVAVVTLSLVPAARATLGEVVHVGAVRLLFGSQADQLLEGASGLPASELDLAGETTLAAARREFPHPIMLPTYPAGLGEPDRVYLQRSGPAAGVALVWIDEAGSVKLGLFELTGDALSQKVQPTVLEQTEVNGANALWTEGPYLVESEGDVLEQRRLIEGHVLIWEQTGVTYRLETHLPIAEARRIAESLQAP